MSAGGSKRAILAALSANAGIAVAKFVGAAITGSASMLAEGVHSVADTANQGLLLFGQNRAEQQADELHPFGYGRYRRGGEPSAGGGTGGAHHLSGA